MEVSLSNNINFEQGSKQKKCNHVATIFQYLSLLFSDVQHYCYFFFFFSLIVFFFFFFDSFYNPLENEERKDKLILIKNTE